VSFEITDEQAELVTVVADLLSSQGQPRNSYDGGPALDKNAWTRLAELGLVAMTVPATSGGTGAQFFDQVLVAERIGAAVAAVPVVATSVAARVLAAADAPELTAVAVSGERIVGAIVSAGRGLENGIGADPRDDGWALSGSVPDVLEGAVLDDLVVLASTPDGPAWFAVAADAPGVALADQPSLDQSQRLGALTLNDAVAQRLLDGPAAAALVEDTLRVARIVLAAEATGAAATALAISVEYAKTRRQFGQPIGRYQAIKHKLVDMLLDTENARSAVYNAAWSVDEGRDDAVIATYMAKAVATENAAHVTAQAIQVHGGIGNTWEHDCHLYLRRAKACELALGDPEYHFQRIADLVLDTEGAVR
jgi:alkylation response protein AidB-like acyl-CoA dehydrogenase